jgi:hypothetical protein
MAGLRKDKYGQLLVNTCGIEVPYSYLSGYGVVEFCRTCLGMESLIVNESRGSGDIVGKMLSKEGQDWVRRINENIQIEEEKIEE